MYGRLLLILILGLGPAVSACGDGGKAAADAAINSAQTAFDAVHKEAALYVPDQVKGVEDALAAAKERAMKEDYTQALSEATSITPQISALTEAVAAKKTELTGAWNRMSMDLPKTVGAIQSRVATLAKSRRLPKGVTKDNLTSAKADVDMMTATWADATKAFAAGNLVEAVSKAESVKTKAAAVTAALGMPSP